MNMCSYVLYEDILAMSIIQIYFHGNTIKWRCIVVKKKEKLIIRLFVILCLGSLWVWSCCVGVSGGIFGLGKIERRSL